MDLELLERTLAGLGEPAYRARQVLRWSFEGAEDYGRMTDVPARVRDQLTSSVPYSTLALVQERRARDGTVKALFRTADGRPLEAVLMRFRDGRRSVCLSSQSGCPLTCSFCATGAMRFGRNLSVSEILDQVLHFRRREASQGGGAERGAPSPDHVVFMGMGEPMLNLDAVLGACRELPAIGVAQRRIAISTVGWVPGIERLTAEAMPVRLALSLHAPDDALRSTLMPVNDRYPIAEVLAACSEYHRRKRRRVFVEYVMLAGVNDAHAHAVALAELLDPRAFKVNLIPYNPTDSPYAASSPKAISAFRAVLERRGIGVTVRVERGREIEAACGQLAAAQAPARASPARSRRSRSSDSSSGEGSKLAMSGS